ncbi:ABC transporter ATP-binding protein [Motiliproteus sediminis]|uniref:ABC transporter ATP-binding protein n=1 Tax=Motiliproteus sediminis TaxID=1468178 RepID=UPI001AF014AD|nr:ATP-binding cassette domain-containing protein [Motiliproteus sediminis]
MIRLTIARKLVATRPLYRDFTLQLEAGELVCLLGPSGCGKTTLLNLVAGLDQDFDGRLEGLDRCRLGYLFQEPRLLPWRTVAENLTLVAPARADQVERLLGDLELEGCAAHYPRQLSLGMARRAALARALMVEPQLLLLDEPFVSLDPPTAQAMQRVLQRVRQRYPEMAVLMVSHDVREALALADRVLVLGGAPTTVRHQLSPHPGACADQRALEERQLLAAYPLSASS